MELFHELPVREAGGTGSVVTIGSFDGVHIGHRRLIRRVRETAERTGMRSTVVTFDPHPRCVVDPSGCPPMLSSLAERIELLEEAGAEQVVVLAFTEELRTWSAERFAAALVERLGMRRLLVGPGFALGRGREGTVDVLQDLGRERGFTVTRVAPSIRGGAVVSSGRIREAIATAKFADAIAMLGRPYVLDELVERGNARGAGLGVPTANLRVDPSRCIPSAGVYAGWLDAGDGWRPAATGIGTRPTFGGGSVTVEAHVLDFDGDLYDREVRLALVRRLRPELAFDSIPALVAAMARDIARTRHILARSQPPEVSGNSFVVMNPASAGGRTLSRWPATMRALRAAGVAFEVHRTVGRGDATQAVRSALERGTRTIVAVGGDGTLNEVVNGFFDATGTPIGGDAMLALLPSGTGGDFRRAVGIPDDVDAAARLIAIGSVRHIDAGRIEFAGGDRRFFINIADAGMGGEVVARVNRRAHKAGGARGSAIFLGSSLMTLLRYTSRHARIELDGMVIERDVRSVVVANGRYFGGGMHVAPNAVLDDGQFDVVIIGETGRTRALTGIPSLYRGRHLNRREVEMYRARTVRVTCDGEPMLFDVEGEQVGTTPATLTCLPDAIALCVPEGSGGRSPSISC